MSDSLDVCLVVPPFEAINYPMLGAPVLASALKARGLKVELVFANMVLGACMGFDRYDSIRASRLSEMLGDRMFVPYAYSDSELENLGQSEPLSEKLQELFDENMAAIGPFLDECVGNILIRNPKIVGISTSLQQNLAAIAIARRIKERAPEICIVLGGANCAHPMGATLLKIFPWIDHVFSGEADVSFPDFCERVVRHNDRSAPRVVFSEPIKNMTEVFPPDYSDFMRLLEELKSQGKMPDFLPESLSLEASRGCWWGQKSHCTFCGLNGEGMGFRSKPADRVLEEIKTLFDARKVKVINFADNIMPLHFLRDVLPTLATWPERPNLFFEIKANMKREQVTTLARGGVHRIQPGIESLSSHVLKLMRKGVSGMQNLVLLRECRSSGIYVTWNMLIGFPGETREDYLAMISLMPKLVHLQMPTGVFPISITRYSPHFDQHREMGIPEIRPFENYFGLYPKDAPVEDLVYHFRGIYTTEFLQDESLVKDFRRAIAQWKFRWFSSATQSSLPSLQLCDEGKDEVKVIDTRHESKTHVLSRQAADTLRYFEQPRTPTGHPPQIQAEISALVAEDLIIEYEGALLSVVTRGGADTIGAPTGAEQEMTSI